MKSTVVEYEDVIGATASIACAVHCLAAPFLVALAPVLYGEEADLWTSGSLILLSGAILLRGWLKHRHAGPPTVFVVGSTLLIASHLNHEIHHELGPVGILAVALCFVIAHVYNFKCSKKCCDDHLDVPSSL